MSERMSEDMLDKVIEDIILDCNILICKNFKRRYIYILYIYIYIYKYIYIDLHI